MPKQKTQKAAAKRFERTGSGKIKRRRKNSNHFFRHKTSRAKRKIRHSATVSNSDKKSIDKLLN